MLTVDRFPTVSSAAELAGLIEEIGFIPFFDCGIKGFSVKAVCDPRYWFAKDVDGPWEWKTGQSYAYAKLLRGKAVFISPEWYGVFACYRRDGYDYEGMYEDGFLPRGAYDIVRALEGGSMLSTRLREKTGYVGRDSGFDGLVNLLQMKCFILPVAFEYAFTKSGKPYGWGLARYALSDERYGNEIGTAEGRYTPKEARETIAEHIAALCPTEERRKILSLLK